MKVATEEEIDTLSPTEREIAQLLAEALVMDLETSTSR